MLLFLKLRLFPCSKEEMLLLEVMISAAAVPLQQGASPASGCDAARRLSRAGRGP